MSPATGILVMDRHPIGCDGLKRSLSQFPHIHVLGSVATGEEALTFMMGEPPDVIVLRLQQPSFAEIMCGKGWEELDILPHIGQRSKTTRMLILAHSIPDAKKYDVVRFAKNFAHAGIELSQLAEAIGQIAQGRLHRDHSLIPEDSSLYLDNHEGIRRLGKGIQWVNLRLVAQGFGNEAMARERIVSPDTIKTELKQLYSIAHAKTRPELILWVGQTGVLTNDPHRQSPIVIAANAS